MLARPRAMCAIVPLLAFNKRCGVKKRPIERGSITATIFQTSRVGCRVFDRVLDVAVSEVILNEPRIGSLIGQGEAARVPQHVRMSGAGRRCGCISARENFTAERYNGLRRSLMGLAQQRYVKSHRNLFRSPRSGPHPGRPYRPIRVTGVGRPQGSFCFRGPISAESVRRRGPWTSGRSASDGGTNAGAAAA